MSEKKIVFEHVGDIGSKYPYLCVYDDIDNLNPFMEISVTDEKELQFTIYKGGRDVVLGLRDWQCIQEKAYAFLPKAIEIGEDRL